FGQALRKWTVACLPLFFPLALRTGANAAQGGNFHGVFEASPLGPKGGQKPRAHGISGPREIPKQELSGCIRGRVEELGLPSIRKNFGPNDEPSISQLALPGVRVRLPPGNSVPRSAPNACPESRQTRPGDSAHNARLFRPFDPP